MPKVSVIVRKAYGAGLYAMSGPAFEPEATIALPTAKIAVMGPEAAVNAVFANKIAAIEDPDERAALRGRAAPALRGGRRPLPPGLGAGHRRGGRLPRPPRARSSAPRPRRRARTATSATAATASPRSDGLDWRSAGGRRHAGPVDLPALPDAVVIRDVGPRDGLQPEAPVAVEDRVRLIEALVAAGVTRIEAAAFVSPKAVPAMAGAAEVLGRGAAVGGRALLGARAQRAGRRAGARVRRRRAHRHRLAVGDLQPAQRPHVDRRVGRRRSRTSAAVGRRRARWTPCSAAASARPTRARSPPADVAALADAPADSGCAAITCADTTGMATPRRDRRGGRRGRHRHRAAPPRDPGHRARVAPTPPCSSASPASTRRWAASAARPFAAGAAGNLATEELVALLDDLGVTHRHRRRRPHRGRAPGRRAGRAAGPQPGGRRRPPHPAGTRTR